MGRDNVSEVKAALDIVEVVGDYVSLKPAGALQFKGICPFHQEKTPSFHVHRERQIYHCFGCGKGGDILTFIQEIDGIDFRDALQLLADKAGVRLERFSGGDAHRPDDRSEIMKLSSFAARFFRDQLGASGASAAHEHLQDRGLGDSTLERFGVGYGPEGWNSLIDAAREAGFKDKTLEAAGLAKQGSRGLYDRFRHRVMFPIREVSGKVVAFGGRALGDDPAKYMNSPESSVYHKSRVLYGLHEARDAMRAEQSAIVVEGYFDLLRCVDAGIENVVATCGTALTAEQARLIRRYAPEVLIVFDGDAAGIRAALRSVGVLASAGLTVRSLTLPDGDDPDDFIKACGVDAFNRLANEAPGFVQFYVRMNRDRIETIEGRTAVARELFEVIRGLDDALQQDEYLKLLAAELSLDEYRCRDAFRESAQGGGARSNLERAQKKSASRVNAHDQEFVSILLCQPSWLSEAYDVMEACNLPESPLFEVIQALKLHEADPMSGLESEGARQLYLAAATAPNTWANRAEELVRERLARFKRDVLLGERDRLQDAIRQAQRDQDDDRLTELTLKKLDVIREIERAGAA